MSSLDKLFYWRGIADTYYNYRGECTPVSRENRLGLLRAMGADVDSDEAIAQAAQAFDAAPWRSWLPSFLLCESDDVHFLVNLKPDELDKSFTYRLFLEDCSQHEGTFVPSNSKEVGDYLWDGIRYSRRAISIDSLPLGYHKIEVSLSEDDDSTSFVSAPFVIVPKQAYNAEWVEQNERPWGIIVQLYTLRSEKNWGVGDFSDLKALITFAAEYNIDIIGLNPLHVLRTPVEHHCSPYSPSDRRFIDPLYIDLTDVPEFQDCIPPVVADLQALRAPDWVEYGAVDTLKHHYFTQMFQRFLMRELGHRTQRASAFLNFVRGEGHALEDYCIHRVSVDVRAKSATVLQGSSRVAFLEQYDEKIQFHQYLQWLAHHQLAECQALAESCGMKVGLMRDLAVGADGGGSEVNTNADLFCRDAAVGAPPDPLAEKGQNWGLPPMDPATLKKNHFEHFINLLRKNMEYCGALRMDHAMSLLRLWWCPPGKTADFGAYVYYPFREMLGLLKLESVRHKCMVVGEDMGVVPPEFRQALYDSHIFTNKLFYFEKTHDNHFKLPHNYEAKSLAMLTNHDVPTLASWWAESDLDLRNTLDLLEEGVAYEDVKKHRAAEKGRLLLWLKQLGLEELELHKTKIHEALLKQPMTHELMATILLGASRCSSQLFVVQLEDLELMDSPVNVPGTSDQYPNWRRKLAVPLEAVFADVNVAVLMQAIAEERQGLK